MPHGGRWSCKREDRKNPPERNFPSVPSPTHGEALRWSLASAWRLLMKIGFNCVAGRSRWQHFKMTLLGIAHGVVRRAGPL